MSAFSGQYGFPSSTSGAAYMGDPQEVVRRELVNCFDKPKSIILSKVPDFIIFSSFRSLFKKEPVSYSLAVKIFYCVDELNEPTEGFLLVETLLF